MSVHEMPREEILTAARTMAERVLTEEYEWVTGDCDSLSREGIYSLLESKGAAIVVCGDWRGVKVDVYDAVLNFAEDNYRTIRQEKYDSGMYVVAMRDPLGDTA